MKKDNLLKFQKDGSPFSTQFDDIYFDTFDGCEQSRQVFLEQNNIEERLIHSKKTFTIAETGFGTGLNFLLTLQLYHNLTQQSPQIDLPDVYFISTEKYPLSAQQIQQSLKMWEALQTYTKTLIEQYPTSFEQPAEFTFLQGKVKLVLHFGDSADCLSRIRPRKRMIDAWYLDGFSPRKNPDMWSNHLFAQIERLSIEQSTLATFTIAGDIRRKLIKSGFRVTKNVSTGKKKESLSAVFQQSTTLGKSYQLRPKITKPMHTVIIGGGIASACAAYSLTKKGIKVVMYCQDNNVAEGASSNAIGALFPLLHQQKDDISEFYEQAFWRARELYDDVLAQGYKFSHQWCGLLDISFKESRRKRQTVFEKLNAWDPKLIRSISALEASKISNISLSDGGIFMPNAGWVSPPELVKALLKGAQATNRLKIETGNKVHSIKSLPDKKWQLTTDKNTVIASTLIVCGGAESSKLNIINQLPLSSVRGQVSNMKANNALAELKTVICHKGYLTPQNKGVQCIGATFDKNDNSTETRIKDDEFNLNMLAECLPTLPQWQSSDIVTSKARLRCMTPDHLPMVGAVPKQAEHIQEFAHLRKDKNWRFYNEPAYYENLYIMTGLGARGLCSAPLLADILTADLTGEPYPVNNKMLFNLAPNRFIIRDLIKRKL